MDNFDLKEKEYLIRLFQICVRQVFKDTEESNEFAHLSDKDQACEIVTLAQKKYLEILGSCRQWDSEYAEEIYGIVS